MPSSKDLRRILAQIDGRGYKTYKDIQGSYDFGAFTLYIDHVQGDPFASPSKARVRVPQRVANISTALFNTHVRKVALEDFFARLVRRAIHQEVKGNRGTGKSGMIAIDAGSQEVLQRTAVVITNKWIEARLEIGLPAAGRTVLGKQADAMLIEELPRIVEQSLRWHNVPQGEGEIFVSCVENQEFMRAQLDRMGFVGFIADGSILPRSSGVDDHPLSADEAIPFKSPESLRVTLALANPMNGLWEPHTWVSGMGIPKGVTLIVGGGYHGKSTLLHALEQCIYPHIPGDGREYVVTTRNAVKIRAEDGRRVEQVDISPFISQLPYNRSTTVFSTSDASGSTSQATNIIEALEIGATTLLLDEDTSATNFMVRDARMQALVHHDHEPIRPFLDRVRELYDTMGVSIVMVMGGSGDYFDVADTVIMMRDYLPYDVTEKAKQIAQEYPTYRQTETTTPFTSITERIPLRDSFDPSRGKRPVKIDAKSHDHIIYGHEPIDLRYVEQLVDNSQTRAVGYAIHLAAEELMNGKASLREVVERIEQFFDTHGLDELHPFHQPEHNPGNFARPRKHEIAAAINRMRTARMRQRSS